MPNTTLYHISINHTDYKYKVIATLESFDVWVKPTFSFPPFGQPNFKINLCSLHYTTALDQRLIKWILRLARGWFHFQTHPFWVLGCCWWATNVLVIFSPCVTSFSLFWSLPVDRNTRAHYSSTTSSPWLRITSRGRRLLLLIQHNGDQ